MKSSALSYLFFLFALCSSYSVVNAQGCCSGGSPISSSLNIGAAPSKSLSFNLAYDYNHLADVIDHTSEIDDDQRKRITHTMFLRSKYAFNDRLSAIAMMSVIRQEEHIKSIVPGRDDLFRKTDGIGDLITMLQYQLYEGRGQRVIVAGGVKWPTGKTELEDAATGLVLPPDLQPGTGSYDFMASLYYGKDHLFFAGNQWNITASYRKSDDYQRFNGQQTYRFGDELFIDLGTNFSVPLSRFLLFPELALRYRFQTRARNNQSVAFNTGGHWLHLTPGFRLAISSQWAFFSFVEIPVYRNLKGFQLTTTYRLGFGVQHDLSFDRQSQESLIELDKKFPIQ